MKVLLVVLLLLGAGFVTYKALAPPERAPDLTFENAAGEKIGWADLRHGKRHLLAVFLLPNCSLSEYSLGLVSDLHAQYGDSVAFVGLAFGTAQVADKYKRDHGIEFDVVGIRTVTDPFAGQEFFDSVRKAYGGSSGIYGGTIVLLDAQNRMLFGLAQKEVRELPDRLATL